MDFKELNQWIKDQNEKFRQKELLEKTKPKPPKLTEEELERHQDLADHFNKWIKEQRIHPDGPCDDVSRSDMEDLGWSRRND
jgi:hypothetical protein